MDKLFLFVDCQTNGVTGANIFFLRLCLKGICRYGYALFGVYVIYIDHVLFPSMVTCYLFAYMVTPCRKVSYDPRLFQINRPFC